jgi:glycosyltransferase involved in cell wall biosynthesis
MEAPKRCKLTIGIPIYNGEKNLREKINSILNQDFDDFELIISDNGSTDSTKKICGEFITKDKRIKFFSHEKNLGANWNFNFILNKACGEYFMWTAADDKILPGFYEKNMETLEKDPNIVCSASQVKYFGHGRDYWAKRAIHGPFKILKKKMVERFQNLQNYSTNGTFESKFRYYLKLRGHHHILYGMYRTLQLKEILIVDKNLPIQFDLVTMLNALRFGDFHVNDKVLMERYDGGISARGFFNYKKSQKLNFINAISSNYPFTRWCFRNFGCGLCLKNLDLFIVWNIEPLFFLMVNIIRKMSDDETKLVLNQNSN